MNNKSGGQTIEQLLEQYQLYFGELVRECGQLRATLDDWRDVMRQAEILCHRNQPSMAAAALREVLDRPQ